MIPCAVCQHSNRSTAHFCASCRAPLLLQGVYRITRLLGSGGYGAVYLAEQLQLGGVLCAIKELQPDPKATVQQVQQAAAQFQLEATLLASLNHPSLPRVTNFFTEGSRYYLVMDYVEGETLEELLEGNHMPLPEAQVLAWADELCDVLTYLHTRKPSPVIHRDIKPANIKITPDGKLKLIDFGISKILAKGTGDAARAVSPPYSPFEQYGKGVSTDARSDIYALGVTLYQLLTNQLPPEAPDRNNELTMSPRQWNPTISANTETVILKAIAEKTAERFQSAAAMKQELYAAAPQPATPTARPAQPLPTPAYTAPTYPPQTAKASTGWQTFAVVAAISGGILVLILIAWSVFTIQQNMAQQATAAARAQATMTAQANATTAARAQSTMTAQANATATAQVQTTNTAQANAAATSQANASATAYWQSVTAANATATVYWRSIAATQATATAQAQATVRAQASPLLVTSTSPFKDLTFGRGGTNSNCRVIQNVATVSQSSLIDDKYFYFAMPLQSSDVGKKIVWSVLDPNGKSFVDSSERELATSDQLCFWQGFPVDAVSDPGRYVLQVTYLGTVVYQVGFTIEYADTSARRPQRNPFGQFSFGRGGVSNTTCQSATVTDQVNQSDLKDDEWFYFSSPFTTADVGNTFTYTVYWPSGSVAYDHVERTIRNQFWLCNWSGFGLGDAPDKGRYRLIVEYKSRVVFDKSFYIQ